ncbi:LytTR family transcriptional regulator DNA-binding domain-containing protein [Bacteroidales bacterium OttesenSCG-928-J16]|nr:LytTR family transcriptional regulator DNA-binding domain-containing protein [Bacteroidales bacterium OttesenSCG-928-J16]
MDIDYNKQIGIKISVKTKSKISYIFIEEILFITCSGNFCTITLIDKREIDIVRPLKEFEEDLKNYNFLRANHHTLVNGKHISEVKNSKGKKNIKIGNEIVHISRRKYFLFK